MRPNNFIHLSPSRCFYFNYSVIISVSARIFRYRIPAICLRSCGQRPNKFTAVHQKHQRLFNNDTTLKFLASGLQHEIQVMLRSCARARAAAACVEQPSRHDIPACLDRGCRYGADSLSFSRSISYRARAGEYRQLCNPHQAAHPLFVATAAILPKSVPGCAKLDLDQLSLPWARPTYMRSGASVIWHLRARRTMSWTASWTG